MLGLKLFCEPSWTNVPVENGCRDALVRRVVIADIQMPNKKQEVSSRVSDEVLWRRNAILLKRLFLEKKFFA